MNALEFRTRGKIILAMKEQFVGNIIFSEEELNLIYEKVGRQLRAYQLTRGATISPALDDWTFIAAVNAAKDWDSSEDTFLNYLFKKMMGTEDVSQKIYRYYTDVIDRLGQKGRIIMLDCVAKKYYGTTLLHAFAPICSTMAFFDLCWSIYCDDLDFSYLPDEHFYQQIALQLKNRLSNHEKDDDDLELGSHIYSFRIGVVGLAVSYPDIMAGFLEKTIGYLHKLFHGEAISTSKYYEQAIYNWWMQKTEDFGKAVVRRSRRERIVTDYHAIIPKYIMKHDQVYLHIPPIRLSDHLDLCPEAFLTIAGTALDPITLYTKGSGLAMTTEARDILMDCSSSQTETIDISLTLKHNEQVIYTSGDSLKRSYLLFKDDREIYAQECLPGNYSLYIQNFDCLSQYPENISRFAANLFTIYAENGDVLQAQNKTIFFTDTSQKRDIQFQMEKRNDVEFYAWGETYTVIDGEIWVSIESNQNILDYGVRYEEQQVPLSALAKKEEQGVFYYSVTQLLANGTPQKISLFSYSRNKILAAINVIKFQKIQIQYDKELYYDLERTGTVHFLTENFEESTGFSLDQEEVLIPFRNGALHVYPPVLQWSINDGAPTDHYAEGGIWYQDISNTATLSLNIPSQYQAVLYLGTHQEVAADRSHLHCYKLGETIHSMIGKPDSEQKVELFVQLDNRITRPLACIYLEEQLKGWPVHMQGFYDLLWSPMQYYVGDREVSFRLILKREQEVMHEFFLGFEQQTLSLRQFEEGTYTVQIFSVSKGPFVRRKELSCIDSSNTICIGNEKQFRFHRKVLTLCSVMLSGRETEEQICPYYISNLNYMDTWDGNDFYSGTMFIIRRDGSRKYLNHMPDDHGNYDAINPVRLEMRTNNSCWLVSGVNPEDMNDFNAEFTLDADNGNQLSNRDCGTKAIDYFYFLLS